MSKFIQSDQKQAFLLPPDLRDWIPEDDLAHFVLEAVERVGMEKFNINKRGTGSAQYHPRMMLALLIYCYANGIFSSRKIERATYRDIGVRFITANLHPDHDTICQFRTKNIEAISETFLQVLLLAKELELLKVGIVSIDGTKLDANASKHKSIRYDRATELVEQLKIDIDELLSQAEAADKSGEVDNQTLPKELARREKLKDKLDQACERLKSQAKKRAEREQAEYEKKCREREQRPGRSKGKKIKPPSDQPKCDEQTNLTDPDSRLMRKNKSSEFRQSYNAQAAVDAEDTQLILGTGVSQCASDRNELSKVVDAIDERVGMPATVLADNGYANGDEVKILEKREIEVLVATGAEGRKRQYDFRPVKEETPKEPKADWLQAMQSKMESDESREKYKLRKQTVEPVFGIIKNVLGFRQFLLRGIGKVELEWQLVALAYNCKRLHRLCSG